ncbi:hypothetical protein SAMN05421863_108813 [Nitrosomonas communis]|uniref:Transposase n=1 Tax=Nitrosomonas communis TaxID=44574 RepID=A0A1I4VQZ6_9PROT|nr:hypothetical protein SAMN05421863_108813 [Nitrosomonas communis]
MEYAGFAVGTYNLFNNLWIFMNYFLNSSVIVKTVTSLCIGTIHFVESCFTNSILEGINSKIKFAEKWGTRSCRDIKNYTNINFYFLYRSLQFTLFIYGIHIEPLKSYF